MEILGIHHITAIASDAKENIDFYSDILGLRFVKKTVNFDAPNMYHLYFGDKKGSPGSNLTFFIVPNSDKGEKGTGQVTQISFAAPEKSKDYWIKRLKDNNIKLSEKDNSIEFEDPDGLGLAIVFEDTNDKNLWENGPVPEKHVIRRFYGATLTVKKAEGTANLLSEVFGFEKKSGKYISQKGSVIEVEEKPKGKAGYVGSGTVHHIAWRAKDKSIQARYREKIMGIGLSPTSFVNRHYFRSIYFREFNNILFEIATDGPGFLIDEKESELGNKLALPPWLEEHREKIEKSLSEIK